MAENRTLQELYDEAIAAAVKVVTATNEKKPSAELKDLKKGLRACVDAYNELVADTYYHRLAREFGADAVRKALEAEETAIPDCIGIAIKATKEDVAYYETTKPIIRINLYKMQKAIGVEYFHSADWFPRMNVLARLMAMSLNQELGGNATFQYIIDEAAKEFKLNAEANPTSNASMVKAFQAVVDDIIWVGDEVNRQGKPVNSVKFTAKNWAYVKNCMSREGSKVNEVSYGSPMKCMQLVCNCINVILTNAGYNIQVS